jgi:hypothetical protein
MNTVLKLYFCVHIHCSCLAKCSSFCFMQTKSFRPHYAQYSTHITSFPRDYRVRLTLGYLHSVSRLRLNQYIFVRCDFSMLFTSTRQEYVSQLHSPTGLLYISKTIYEYRHLRWNDTDRNNRRTWRNPCPSATLSTTNPTQTNSGLRGKRLASTLLSPGTAFDAV